ncbi:UNVERIFIED_CONTAM: putative late blight resistance proteinR1B-16 [Sesamum calycinum]|uniref:Late blight resistance proteinR1B-16 n=1 Tax=Sesamum calycinum TaxID=2727403 RepID=A0AAW2PP81_9LAMI
MNEIGKLPNLKVLKLRDCDFRSSKWEAEDGEFCQLQYLLMEHLNLVSWTADDTHFPRLEHLVIRRCGYLEEIPLAIGDIPTLKVIEWTNTVVQQQLQQEKYRRHNLTSAMTTFKFVLCDAVTSVHGKQSLESRIRDAAYDAEDILESHLVEQILSRPAGESFIFSPPDVEKLIEELDTTKEEMLTILDNNQTDTSSAAVSSSRQDPNPKNIIVGVGEDLIQLKDRLIGQPSKALQVIPIVGMGGIDYQMQKLRDVLLSLLGCVIEKLDDKMLQEKSDKLALRLYQALIGRRYLIVLDDMWDVKPWDDTRRFFPDENNGSRIIVTTRESSVADYTGSESWHHQMNLLKDDESWNLLRQKVFAPEETCSPELEKVGRKIAKNCRGLPLAIHVIGGILSQAKTSQDFWEQVSDNVSSTVADKGGEYEFSNILSLSYNHLPNHLRPCFLYMGAFPEDNQIRSSRLISLLVAEGFVRPISDKSLEEAAKMHLKALVDRNLIFVSQQGTNGNAKSYSIHDLLRDLCVRKAHEEKFLFVHGWTPAGNLPINTSYLRRVCSHGPFSFEDAYISMEQISLARSLLLFNNTNKKIVRYRMLCRLRLLRVLDLLQARSMEFRKEIRQLVNLRYLAVKLTNPLTSPIFTLCNLQTLIAKYSENRITLLMGRTVIWGIVDMRQVSHIKIKGGAYVRYHGESSRNRYVILDKLQTLSPVPISELSDRVLEALPNLEKLGISWDREADYIRDLSRLHKLHKLKCIISRKRVNFSSNFIFPPSIKKLTLTGFHILDDHMNQIGNLPNLETLKLRFCTFPSGKWETKEGEFCQLQYLVMQSVGPVYWEADDTHFPRLKHLVIRRGRLMTIPLAIGDIPTLKVIEVDSSGPSVVASAREIQEVQLDIGNDELQVRILGHY